MDDTKILFLKNSADQSENGRIIVSDEDATSWSFFSARHGYLPIKLLLPCSFHQPALKGPLLVLSLQPCWSVPPNLYRLCRKPCRGRPTSCLRVASTPLSW